jgi:hypothetical protein
MTPTTGARQVLPTTARKRVGYRNIQAIDAGHRGPHATEAVGTSRSGVGARIGFVLDTGTRDRR